MSRVLFLDPVGGVAGDMFVASLLDLGVPLEHLRRGLAALGLEGLELREERALRGPFAARRFVVEGVEDLPAASARLAPRGTRDYAEIDGLLAGSELPPRVRERARAVFRRLAEAEARVHGVEPERVHFHEVGALDSLADIVGACLALEWLGVDRLVCGPLPLGHGSTRSAHGRLPLPAPATLLLLEGWPVQPAPAAGEWVTPTGAALVSALAEPGRLPAMRLRGVGLGAGSRDLPPLVNVLRAVLGEEGEEPALQGEELPKSEPPGGPPLEVERIEVLLDDLPGELWPPLSESLLAAGALDAWAAPVLAKKGRPGLLVGAVVPARASSRVAQVLLEQASAGLRLERARRLVLPRRWERVETDWGPVRLKVLEAPSGPRAKPEYEDCARLAREAGVSARAVRDQALARWHGWRYAAVGGGNPRGEGDADGEG